MMESFTRAATRRAIQLVNRSGPLSSWLLKDSASLDEDAILAAAKKRAGLADFGDASFHEALQKLLYSYQTEANLSLIGQLSAREYIVSLLTNLLYLERDRQLNPGIETERIDAPIFMLGLPRTGSTLLHGLLAQDERHRVPLTWEVMFPSAGRNRGDSEGTRIRRCDSNLKWFHRLAPNFKQIHDVGATLPQECIAITAHVLQSIVFHTMHNVPSYQAWLDRTGYREAFRFHRRFLKHLQHARRAERWLLKAPGHLFGLADLIAEYPDAVFIQTHRDPARVIGSISSHAVVLRTAFSEVVDEKAAAENWVQLWETALAEELEVRTRAPNQFIDVQYQDIEKDPLGVVRNIYDALGETLTPATQKNIERYLAENPKGRNGIHRYALPGSGITGHDSSDGFTVYRQNFKIPKESATD
jgi:hypothetical protein